MSAVREVVRKWLSDVYWYSRLVVKRPLRAYQREPARAIVESVLRGQGREFAILFPRQSGKNEMQAQTIAYLLNVFQRVPGAQIVQVSPTFKPQSQNAMRRLQSTLTNDWNRRQWARRDGYIYTLGHAACLFLSADPGANVVGATANVLLLVDEAQHVQEPIYLERFAPMAASTNATIAYFGTAWTSRTLLARTIASLREQEASDGVQRVYLVTPDQVAAENPPYGQFVARQVQKLGRTHPLVKTQYYNEPIDAEGGMFPPARRALMQGQHPRHRQPTPGRLYALLLDVAGEDEGAPREGHEAETMLANPRRDSTALTIVEATPRPEGPPAYAVVDRKEWIGTKHTALYSQIRALFDHWRARYLVVDATGVGAGLASFLVAALGEERVLPYEFSSKTKSDLGYGFLAVVDTGRFKDYAPQPGDADHARFVQQLEFCQYEVLPGPAHMMRWAVPDGARDPATGELIHDDLILSAALCAALDEQDWTAAAPALVVKARDPLAGRDRDF